MPSPEHSSSNLELEVTPLESSFSPLATPESQKEPAEALFERLKLKEQYLAQVKVLAKSGLLKNFESTPEHPLPETGVIGLDGQRYYLPELNMLLDKLQDPEKRQILEQKLEQGFTKLLLVPYALPLSVLIERYKDILLQTQKESGLKSTNGSKLDLDTANPVYVWDKLTQADNPQTPQEEQLEYQVTNYKGKTKAERGGYYKSELLQKSQDNAWQILLIEDNPDIPQENQGQTTGGRKQLEANKSPQDYLNILQTKPEYHSEQGLTPEANLILYLTYLQEQHTILDDYQNAGTANFLVGTYLTGSVLDFFWYRDRRQASLSRNSPDIRDSSNGCRPVARF